MGFMRSANISLRAPALVLGALGATLAFAAPVAAQSLLDNAPMKGTLSFLGIIAPERDPIEYHERAPLVVPKTMALPEPAAQHAPPATRLGPPILMSPANSRRRRNASRPVPASGSEGSTNPDNARSSIWTVLSGRSTSAPIQPAGPDPYKLPESGYIPNGVLRAQGQAFAAQNPDTGDEIRPGYEPKRRYLTDPPSGYRRPSDKATFKKQYGAPVKKDDKPNPLDFVREQAERQKGNYDPDKAQ